MHAAPTPTAPVFCCLLVLGIQLNAVLLLQLLLSSPAQSTELVSLCSTEHQSYTNDGLLTFNTAGLLRESFQCNCTITFPNSTARDAGFLDVIMLKDTGGGSACSTSWVGRNGSLSPAASFASTNASAGHLQTKRRQPLPNVPRETLTIGNNTCSQRPCYVSLRRNGSTPIYFSAHGTANGCDYGGMVIVGFRKPRTNSDKPQSTVIACRTTFRQAAAGASQQPDHRAAHGASGDFRAGSHGGASYTSVEPHFSSSDSGTIKLITVGTAWGIVVFFLLIVIVALSMLYHKARKQVALLELHSHVPSMQAARRGGMPSYASQQSLTAPFSGSHYSFSTDTNPKRKASYAMTSRSDMYPPPPPPIRCITFGGQDYDDASLPASMKLEYS